MTSNEDRGPMRVGVSIIKQLSTAFYSDAANVFEELVSNAYDAGATQVLIDVAEDSITLEDNGSGMSPEELMHFFYISHTDKGDLKKFRHLSRLKRAIIGRFGVGKLSMYRICRSFSISSWKDSIRSHSDFSFDGFEKLDFVDELTLSVTNMHALEKNTGTKIVMKGLRARINHPKIRRHLSKTMPLKPDFKLFVNGVECTPILLAGQEYPLAGKVKDYGNVDGRLVYTSEPLQERDAGIYVRVAGRVVNHNPRLIELSDLRSALTFSRRTFVDIEADWLSDAIKSDRSGFLEDDPKYVALLDWLQSTLNRYNRIEAGRRSEEKHTYETERVTDTLRQRFSIGDSKGPGRGSNVSSAGGTIPSEANPAESSGLARVSFNGKNFRLIVSAGKEDMPAWEVSKDLILLNSAHPLYKEADERGCLDFHALNISIQAIAREVSKTIEEEKENYEKLARQVCKNNK